MLIGIDSFYALPVLCSDNQLLKTNFGYDMYDDDVIPNLFTV